MKCMNDAMQILEKKKKTTKKEKTTKRNDHKE